ncbi:MAG: DNA polymerase III subunit beta [Proteobacteria bacterium]|nr:DNA polymerase III subunit beta [Pseudomonadota bacterium]
MKIRIKKTDVVDVLSKIQSISSRKTNIAITTSVLIKTVKSGISIVSTDLETGFEGVYPALVEKEGSVAINARKLFEIVRDFPNAELYINEIENYWIEIMNQSNVEYRMVGMNPEDFPNIPSVENITYFDMKSAVFKKMIEKTVFISGGSEEKRAHINGIYFESLEDKGIKKLRMVSTDGSRLSKVDYACEAGLTLPGETGIIISKKGLSDVGKFLEQEGDIKIGYNKSHFVLKKDNETIIMRLLEGNFPEYKDIINRKEVFSLKLDRQMFLMMLKRMSIFTSDSYKGVVFGFNKGKLLVSSTNPELGESKEEMNINYNSEPMEIAFNVRYFIETINVIDDESINILLIDNESPCLIEGEKNKNFLSVIMPMRI